MARIVLGSYMVRYPLGGMMSWVLQWIVGFQRLGHEVYFVEKAGYANSCYDPVKDEMSDDCSYGMSVLVELLARFDLERNWCYVDAAGAYYGMERREIEAVFAGTDVFVDMGTHGSWLSEASVAGTTVLVDGEPGFTQMKMIKAQAAGLPIPTYDHYYTTGRGIGTSASTVPTADRDWKHVYHPVVVDLFASAPAIESLPDDAPITTVMNWQSYEPLEFDGVVYGHKDVEFERFIDLPIRTAAHLEIAVSGSTVPKTRLESAAWTIRDAHDVTRSFDTFRDYVYGSLGEFAVCKNGYVATNTGWFSDRGAAYLASGRPVIMQDTGFSLYLPCGVGLFAPADVTEAAIAVDAIRSDRSSHGRAASEIAGDILSASVVLSRFLDGLVTTTDPLGDHPVAE